MEVLHQHDFAIANARRPAAQSTGSVAPNVLVGLREGVWVKVGSIHARFNRTGSAGVRDHRAAEARGIC
jgi:hypothetical protein